MRFLFLLAFLLLPVKAFSYQEVVEVVRSSATVGGVKCSSGTAVKLDTSVIFGVLGTGINRAWVRVQNQDSADAVWLGFDNKVSTATPNSTTAIIKFLGEKLAAGANAPYSIGNGIPIWCKASDDAGDGGVILSFAQWGFK